MDTPSRTLSATQSNGPRSRGDAGVRTQSSIFVPALLIALAVVVWFASQTVQLVRESSQLNTARTTLQTQEQNAVKLRASLDAVAASTAKLAVEGNSNARVVVDELRKRGVTINPSAAPKAQ
jgi:uncharacterized protein HemX